MAKQNEMSSRRAQEIVTAVGRELDARGKGAAVAVVDPHGELLAFLRTASCQLPSINIAINKAFTAARTRAESRSLGDRSRDEGFPLTSLGDPRYVGWGGGVPVIVEGEVIGAVGVSGLPEEEDMELARGAAADAAVADYNEEGAT